MARYVDKSCNFDLFLHVAVSIVVVTGTVLLGRKVADMRRS